MALCITEVDEKQRPTIQYGNMYRLDPKLYIPSFGATNGNIPTMGSTIGTIGTNKSTKNVTNAAIRRLWHTCKTQHLPSHPYLNVLCTNKCETFLFVHTFCRAWKLWRVMQSTNRCHLTRYFWRKVTLNFRQLSELWLFVCCAPTNLFSYNIPNLTGAWSFLFADSLSGLCWGVCVWVCGPVRKGAWDGGFFLLLLFVRLLLLNSQSLTVPLINYHNV